MSEFDSPQYHYFWRHLFATTTFDPVDLAQLRAASRALRHASDRHSRTSVDYCRREHRRALASDRGPRDRTVSVRNYAWGTYSCSCVFAKGESLDVPRLPDSVEFVHFCSKQYEWVDVSELPRRLQKLDFGSRFNFCINERALPPTLTSLRFGWRHDQPVDARHLPRTLTSLSFGGTYCQRVDFAELPRGLLKLRMGDGWPHTTVDVAALPPSLTSLAVGRWFAQDVRARDLPRSLTFLQFGPKYMPGLDSRALPPALVSLRFGDARGRALRRGGVPDVAFARLTRRGPVIYLPEAMHPAESLVLHAGRKPRREIVQ